MAAISALVSRNIARFVHFSLETEFNALRFINYTIPRLCSNYTMATIAVQGNCGQSKPVKRYKDCLRDIIEQICI